MTKLLNTILSLLSSSKPIDHQNRLLSQHSIEPPQSMIHITNSISVSLSAFDQRTSTQFRDLFDFQSTEEMLNY